MVEGACHCIFVPGLRFSLVVQAGIHQTHDWKFDEADWSPSWDLPAHTSSYSHFLHQSLKPCYIVIDMWLYLLGNNQILALFAR